MGHMSPFVIVLTSPVVLAGQYITKKAVLKPLLIFFFIILFTLIIILAILFNSGNIMVQKESSKVIVLSDRTTSMDIFDNDTGEKIFKNISSKIPAKYYQFTGENSSIGDKIIQAVEGNKTLVLLSDGNNNYGRDLFDAIAYVSNNRTEVLAVKQKPIHNDLSVEITGVKNLIIENENMFNIVVRQAGENARYKLDVKIDEMPVILSDEGRNFVQTEQIKNIPVSYTFKTLGTHRIEAVITPETEDWFPTNNKFYKAVYVVPKPDILIVTEDTSTPLYKLLNSLYNVSTSLELPENLTQYKAIVIDNKYASQSYTKKLEKYINDGAGLAVVGGENSYDMGYYNNSPIEVLLPVISKGEGFKEKNIVIIIDASASTLAGVYGNPITVNDILSERTHSESDCPNFDFYYYKRSDPYSFAIACYSYETTVLGLIDANAISIVKYIDGGSSVGVVAFGGTAIEHPLLSMGSKRNRDALEDFIRQIGPEGDVPTQIELGLQKAENMLKTKSGSKLIVILSDGRLPADESVLTIARSLKEQGIEFIVGQMSTMYDLRPEQKSNEIDINYKKLAETLGTSVVVYGPQERACSTHSCLTGETAPSITSTVEPTPEIMYEYPIIVLDANHFITKYINLSASVTVSNDVTPKLGADRLLVTNEGKPILTTWSFGMGRVASFTTDNGAGDTMWAPALYSGENARIISGMIEWSIGELQPREGIVVQAEDIWGGTPGKVVIISNTSPQMKLDGKEFALSQTDPESYEATINPDKQGFHDLSGYGIAVNYPLEYRDVGFNEKMINVIESNGGRVYNEDEFEGLIQDLERKEIKTMEEPENEKQYFLISAIILFLVLLIIAIIMKLNIIKRGL